MVLGNGNPSRTGYQGCIGIGGSGPITQKFKNYLLPLDGKHPGLEYLRQLWWGHQIPAYYYGKGKNDFVKRTQYEALSLAQKNRES